MSNLAINIVFLWIFHFQLSNRFKIRICRNPHRMRNMRAEYWRKPFEVCTWKPEILTLKRSSNNPF
jgi:hypothetical protein